MSKINWDDNMSVGIKAIDTQHKILIEAINSFYDAIGSSSSKDLVSSLLKKMKDYTLIHFNSEEQLLKKHGYQELDSHKSEHRNFITKVDDLEKRIKEGRLVVSIELTTFIKTWLTSHIMVIDKKYTDFLHSKGVS